MFNIQRLLKIFRDLAGGRSPLKVILVLWAFIQRQLRRYLWDRGNQASPKGPQPINDKVFGGPTDEICTKWRMTVMDDDVEEPVSAVVCRSAFPSQSTHGSRSSSRYPSAASSRYGSRSSSRYGSRSSSVTRSTSDHGFSTLPKVRPRSSSQPDFGPYANASGHRLAHYPLPSRSQSRSRSQSVTQPQASFDDPSHMTGSTTKSSEWLSDTLYNSSGPSLPFSTMPDSPSSSDACQSKDPSDLWRESEIIQAMETIESELPSEIDNPYDVQVPNMLAPAPQPTNDSNNTSNFTLTLNAHSSFLPLTPERVPRYNKDFTDESIHTDYLIDPLTISFQQNHVHVDWLMCVHPEGARYFFHQERKVYTDVDISESNNLQLITKFLNDLDNYMNTNGIVISDADLVLDLISDPTGNGGISCAYYFASHENRSIFWFHEFSGTFLSAWNAVKGVTDPGHISLEIEAQYWYHCQLFPTCRQMTLDIIDELRDTLIFWMGDTMTRSKSNSAYNIPELQQMLNLTNTVRKSLDWTSNSRPSLACSIDRLMFIVFRERFINFYGQASARLERDASVYDITFKRTPLVVLLSPLLFFAPDIHLTALKKIKGDGFFRIAAWSGFTEKLYCSPPTSLS